MVYIGTETNRLLKPVYKRTVKFQRDLYIYCKPFMPQAGQIISPWKLLDVFLILSESGKTSASTIITHLLGNIPTR